MLDHAVELLVDELESFGWEAHALPGEWKIILCSAGDDAHAHVGDELACTTPILEEDARAGWLEGLVDEHGGLRGELEEAFHEWGWEFFEDRIMLLGVEDEFAFYHWEGMCGEDELVILIDDRLLIRVVGAERAVLAHWLPRCWKR